MSTERVPWNSDSQDRREGSRHLSLVASERRGRIDAQGPGCRNPFRHCSHQQKDQGGERECAPSATRMPISGVRSATVCEITPYTPTALSASAFTTLFSSPPGSSERTTCRTFVCSMVWTVGLKSSVSEQLMFPGYSPLSHGIEAHRGRQKWNIGLREIAWKCHYCLSALQTSGDAN